MSFRIPKPAFVGMQSFRAISKNSEGGGALDGDWRNNKKIAVDQQHACVDEHLSVNRCIDSEPRGHQNNSQQHERMVHTLL